MTGKTKQHIDMMKDIYTVSRDLGIKTFIWGGYAVDILHGHLTREHSDLDCFTENLVENLVELKRRYSALGYEIEFIHEFWMLKIKKAGEYASFNAMKNIGGIAHWYHIGPQGTVFFPYEWLDSEPHIFYDTPAYTHGVKMAHILKTNIRWLNPEWATREPREKDKADLAILEQIFVSKGINKDDIKRKVWSHNPFWYAKGYEEHFFPVFCT